MAKTGTGEKSVTLGKALANLDENVPASEAWLFRNPEALVAVCQGLQEAAEGKTVYLGPFAPYADEE